VFPPFHKPPYPYLYGRSVDETTTAAAIFDDCYHLALEFPKIIFEHSFKESYCVAHELARVARGIAGQVWLDDPPNFLLPVLLKDLTLISNE
jgi:hypothetical protein